MNVIYNEYIVFFVQKCF